MRKAAMITALVGGVLSVILMIHAGRYNMPPLLIVLIGMWVLLPYDALTMANILSPRWPELVSATLNGLTFVVTLVSLAIYATVAFGPPRPKPAFFFVLLPPLSLVLIAISLLIARTKSRASKAGGG
jgi:hypothetical protein